MKDADGIAIDGGLPEVTDIVPRQKGPGGRPRGARAIRWTTQMKTDFLDHLAATCHVGASAAHVGVNSDDVYTLRRRNAAFTAAWHEALEAGYQLLELQLVGHALAGKGDSAMTNGAVAITGPIDVDLAIRLLTVVRAQTRSRTKLGSPPRHHASKEETVAAIMKKLSQIEAGRRIGH
ncbi:hypothetical protein [uncultured Sphingomonas sp.]|uniref:hypothetical protein n=1 Tax=uncultured Sphingomonas sp. TaxID=158754 RepID=UPI0035CB6FD2